MKNGNANTGKLEKGTVAVMDRRRRISKPIKAVKLSEREVYLSQITVNLYPFDSAYLRRLQDRDPDTESHFVNYFTQLLRIKLRSRQLHAPMIDEVKQETFVRVLEAARTTDGIRQPDRLGAYVNSVCNHVLQELYRRQKREQHVDLEAVEIQDAQTDLQGNMEVQEDSKKVRDALKKLAARDREILRAVFFQDRDKDEVCMKFGVDRGYLRVLLHRAKVNFKEQFKVKKFPRSFGQAAGN